MEKIQVMRKLADWFEDYDWIVYYNQDNPDNFPVFHGNTNSKPDILLNKNGYSILVEVKSGEKHQDILNGIDQTLKYTGEYYSGRTHYHVNNSDLEIDGFFLATEFSKYGYLYSNESNIGYLDYSNKYLTQKMNMTEKPISHSLTRFLWRQWESGYAYKYFEDLRRGRAKESLNLPESKPKIGTVVAKTKHENKQTTKRPFLFANSNEFVYMSWKEIYCLED